MTDDAKSIGLGRELLDYVVAHSGGPDPIATQLAAATRSAFGDAALMNVEQDQGRFLEFLVALTGARTVVEIGTFTGMSALFLARGLGPGGRLICLERDERFVEIGREFWRQAGVEERIEVRIGPAAEALAALAPEVRIDLAFIDADKGGYAEYLDLVLARLSPNGFVAVDNVLWGGAVVDPDDDGPDTRAIRRFNDRVRDDPSLDVVMLSVGDGISLIRRRTPG
jgi:caffeoyl-CoA O-methyltransferase